MACHPQKMIVKNSTNFAGARGSISPTGVQGKTFLNAQLSPKFVRVSDHWRRRGCTVTPTFLLLLHGRENCELKQRQFYTNCIRTHHPLYLSLSSTPPPALPPAQSQLTLPESLADSLSVSISQFLPERGDATSRADAPSRVDTTSRADSTPAPETPNFTPVLAMLLYNVLYLAIPLAGDVRNLWAVCCAPEPGSRHCQCGYPNNTNTGSFITAPTSPLERSENPEGSNSLPSSTAVFATSPNFSIGAESNSSATLTLSGSESTVGQRGCEQRVGVLGERGGCGVSYSERRTGSASGSASGSGGSASSSTRPNGAIRALSSSGPAAAAVTILFALAGAT
ncbi:hypothetical protein C8R44DRAFT_731159 [Mycena epipterygia]|nr:hypothetical protein C8R44DRAFT_731159 [Mycena epipterygia]